MRASPDLQTHNFLFFRSIRSHQNKSEIIFKDKAEVDDFFEKNLKSTYTSQSGKKKYYRAFECRRKNLKNEKYLLESFVDFLYQPELVEGATKLQILDI